MKTSLRIFAILLLACSLVVADKPPNVISYYAVNNTLDGQPMIDMVNVLRFYPVYAMRSQIVWVRITVYYGGGIYSRDAASYESGLYWQSLLPALTLGQAIQRIEVEVQFSLDPHFSAQLIRLDSLSAQIALADDLKEEELKRARAERVNKARAQFSILFDEFKREFGLTAGQVQSIRKKWGVTSNIDSLDSWVSEIKGGEKITLTTDQQIAFGQRLDSVSSTMEEAEKDYNLEKLKYGHAYVSERNRIQEQRDSVKLGIAKQVEIGLTDTSYTGIGVRKSDLVIGDDFRFARILYRNYKPALRRMPALDPAERMGIFRIRYVPFPIVGTGSQSRMHLERPFSQNSPTVFEIGLAFGDAIVPGDEFVVPEFSWRRLGVAFAITENLFNEDASILGLALTYDFNSYGSIGIGGNFAGRNVHGYASLGINKKAFESVVAGLASLFGK